MDIIICNKPNIHINYDFYKHNENVPIKELADILGLEKGKNGNYICPCHNDTHPSLVLTSHGKYENTFKCFACGESGDALMLTMAVRSHINPSEYWTNTKDNFKYLIDAAKFIEEYFPGGLIIYGQEKDTTPKMPMITGRMLKQIGLLPDFLNEKKSGVEFEDKVYLLLDKIDDYLKKHVEDEYSSIIKRFPKLSDIDRRYIAETLVTENEQIEKVYKEIQAFADYTYTNNKSYEIEEER